jgi:hypothetical protein
MLGRRAFQAGDAVFVPPAAKPRSRRGAPGRRAPGRLGSRPVEQAGPWSLGQVPPFAAGAAPNVIQRSPLSDSVRDAWTADARLEALLARLSAADVQGAPGDADVDAEIARLLAGRPDDLWVAQRIRAGELGKSAGRLPGSSGRATPRPIKAFFFEGATARRALVIAGVHGTERQGVEVAERLIAQLATQQPGFTTIVVPTLFPDSAAKGAFGKREGTVETNRNFPFASQDLADAKAAGGGTAISAARDKDTGARIPILPENLLLLELMERFSPERIISIHGTHRPGAAGVFYDPRALRDDETQAARDWAAERSSPGRSPSWEGEAGPEARQREVRDALFGQKQAAMLAQADTTDRDLVLNAAKLIDSGTSTIAGRDTRKFHREKEKAATTAAQAANRQAHPSVAGNVGPTGALDNASWPGGTAGGVSLGGYAPPRGMSVFTVEPPVNRRSTDYPSDKDADVDRAGRETELMKYEEAVRTILLAAP